MALALGAVVAFVRSSSGPPHPAALSHHAGPSTTSPTVATTTTVTVSPAQSEDTQVSAWWSATGESATAALVADLQALQEGGIDTATPSATCSPLSRDAAASAAAPPAPAPAIEREWQLTVSTAARVLAACEEGRTTSLARDLQPALYTIRDLSDQIKPYLDG